MRVEFILPIKAFSLNKYRYGHSPHKTKEAREYEEDVLQRLKEIPELTVMSEKWHGTIEVELVFTYPSAVFYNAKGHISAKTYDLSNVEKPLLDLIINRHMGLDDRFVTKLVSSKGPGEAYSIKVILVLSSGDTRTECL